MVKKMITAIRSVNRHVVFLVSVLFFLSPPILSVAHGQSFDVEISGLLGKGEPRSGISVNGTQIHAVRVISKMYKLNGQRPLWNANAIASLAAEIEDLAYDGLTPDDYRFPTITKILSAPDVADLPVKERAKLDVLLSEAFVRAAYNLYVGKVDAERLDANINFTRSIEIEDPASLLFNAISAAEIGLLFDKMRPQNIRYDWLKSALKRYRDYAAAVGWATVAEGKTLKLGQNDSRVAQVRARLKVTGDYTGELTPTAPDHFDPELVAAVKSFQKRHGLEVDGAVGPVTRAALNVSVEERIDQIRVNLERQRWIMHEAYDEFLIVDIAGFQVYWVKDDEVIWQEQVQVGKEYTQTPLFKDTIRYLEINPTWTIPPGIMRRSILPALKKDPNFLDKKGYLLLTQDGERINPKTIDWQSIKTMPYIVRQPPGPDNALGLVKFMFPNPHFVFLHDTNHREFFDRTGRAFSSGCVRVQNPFDLAERLLAGQDGWDRKQIDAVVASGKNTRVNLNRPMRIIIAYLTARSDGQRVFFKSDVYNRDEAVLSALDGDFRVRKQDRKN
jgi:murein L,D-transpeptidase YcbB/YkuD